MRTQGSCLTTAVVTVSLFLFWGTVSNACVKKTVCCVEAPDCWRCGAPAQRPAGACHWPKRQCQKKKEPTFTFPQNAKRKISFDFPQNRKPKVSFDFPQNRKPTVSCRKPCRQRPACNQKPVCKKKKAPLTQCTSSCCNKPAVIVCGKADAEPSAVTSVDTPFRSVPTVHQAFRPEWELHPGTTIIEAYVDDQSDFWLRGDNIVWKNVTATYKPGLASGRDEPTWVNGVAWYPLWDHNGESGIDLCEPFRRSATAGAYQAELVAVGPTRNAIGIERGSMTAVPINGSLVLCCADPEPGARWFRIRVTPKAKTVPW